MSSSTRWLDTKQRQQDHRFLGEGRLPDVTKLVNQMATIVPLLRIIIASTISKLLTSSLMLLMNAFDQPGYATYRNLEKLLLKAANGDDYAAELEEVTAFYGNDLKVDELTTQLSIFTTKFASEQQTSKRATLGDVVKFVQSLTVGQRTFFSEVCNVIRLLLVLPATNAISERSFSTMRRIKSYLRSTMGQARLNHLMLLNIHREQLDGLDMKIIANEFVRESEHRQRLFLS